RREVVVQPRAAGGTEHVAPHNAATPRPALPDRALRRLARLGAAIERHFGGPQDVQWAWAGGQPFIVPVRPLTALPDPLPLPIRPTPGILLAPLRILRQARRYDPVHWRADPLLAEAQASARVLEARDPRALAWADLLVTVREALAIAPLLGEIRLRYIPGAA